MKKILLGYIKEETETTINTGTTVQEESEEVQTVQVVSADSILVNDISNNIIR